MTQIRMNAYRRQLPQATDNPQTHHTVRFELTPLRWERRALTTPTALRLPEIDLALSFDTSTYETKN